MKNYIVLPEDEFLKIFKEVNEEKDSKKTFKLNFLKKLLAESMKLESIVERAYYYSQRNAQNNEHGLDRLIDFEEYWNLQTIKGYIINK